MNTVDPSLLIGPDTMPGLPAPYWFLLSFKVLGFILHAVPMNLWFAGIIVSMLLNRYGGPHSRRQAARLMEQMPFIISAGVNLGIVPLLFMQVAYYKVFYPATILMAWPWFLIIVLLAVAYYGVYLYALNLRGKAGWLAPIASGAGWLSALLFIVIGFIFSNAMSLMVNLSAWPKLWEATSVAGAPLGIGHNLSDPTLLPRFLMFFGLALMTLAVYMIFDARILAGRESLEYRHAVPGLAMKTATVALAFYAGCGSWYFFSALPEAARTYMTQDWHVVLTGVTAMAIGLPWLLIAVQLHRSSAAMAVLTALAQVAAISANAVSRQIVQNRELSQYLDVAAGKVNPQWDTLAIFLLLFVGGLVVLFWMVAKVVQVQRHPSHRKA